MRPVDFVHSIVTGPARRRVGMTLVAFWLFVCGVVGAVAGARWVDGSLGLRLGMPLGAALAAGLPALGMGVALISWCIVSFGSARGTPVPFSPPRGLVALGPYRHTRNPMLTGLFVALAGAGLVMRSPTVLLVLVPAVVVGAWLELRLIEEPELEKRLGAAYTEYRSRVPMFVPRLRWARHVAAEREGTG